MTFTSRCPLLPGAKRPRPVLLLVLAALTTWAVAPEAGSQTAPIGLRPPTTYPADASAAPAPFGPGERLVYRVKVGILSAGEGEMSVAGLDTVRGNDAYLINMTIQGGIPGARVKDAYSSWLDIRTLQSWRFVQDIHQVRYRSFRHFEMHPERQLWVRKDNDESGPLASALPLDDIAFIYFLRTIPLEVGKTYTFDRYFKAEGNPVVVTVLRRDRRRTDAGDFPTLVLQPTIQTRGIFHGGRAEIHLTDDARRIPVYVKSDIPRFPGSLTLHLKEIHPGVPLHPESRARVAAAGRP